MTEQNLPESKPSSKFERYQLELEEELKIDDFNVKEKQSQLPAIKHKWVARLIQEKFELNQLHILRKQGIVQVCDSLVKNQEVHLTQKTTLMQAENHAVIKKIDEKIKESENLILYLEKVEKIWSQVTFDIKNLIELRRMETQ